MTSARQDTPTRGQWIADPCGRPTPVLDLAPLTPAMAALLGPLADSRDYVEVTTSWGRWAVLRGDVMTDESEEDDEPDHELGYPFGVDWETGRRIDEPGREALARVAELALYAGAANLVPRRQPLGVRLSGLVIDAGIAVVRVLARFAR